MAASSREQTPLGGSATRREMSPESAMTAEELRRVNLKKVEEEQMKQRFTSSTHEEAARQSLGSSAVASSLTPSRASRESLLEDLEKIRKERAIEEERLRSSQSSRAGGLMSTSSRGGILPQSGTRASRDGTVGVGGTASSVLGPSFSPLQPLPSQSQAGVASSAAQLQRSQQQQQQQQQQWRHAEDSVPDDSDLPPPPPTSARTLPGGTVAHTQESPAVGRKIFASEESGAGGGGRGSGLGGAGFDGGSWHTSPVSSSGVGAVAVPKELVPVIHAAVEHSMASVWFCTCAYPSL